MRLLLALLLLTAADPAAAEIVVAATTIRANSLIGPDDLKTRPGDAAGIAADSDEVVGKEARTTIYAGRPVRLGDIGPPALVDRNQIVTLAFRQGTLTIRAEGRALDRAGAGDRVRAMNLGSRNVVVGQVAPDGTIIVSGMFQ